MKRLAVFAALVLLAAACHDSTGPEDHPARCAWQKVPVSDPSVIVDSVKVCYPSLPWD